MEVDYGHIAFEAYAKAQDCEGLTWGDLTDENRQAWRDAAQAVLAEAGVTPYAVIAPTVML